MVCGVLFGHALAIHVSFLIILLQIMFDFAVCAWVFVCAILCGKYRYLNLNVTDGVNFSLFHCIKLRTAEIDCFSRSVLASGPPIHMC